jgi:hypothetical protein
MKLLPLLLLTAVLLPACATAKGESFTKVGFDPLTVQRLAVVDGNNPTFKVDLRQQLVDAIMYEFFKKGWDVVERANIQKALDEVKFQNGDLTTADQRQKMGEILNVQALAFVNIGGTADEMSITIKMVEPESGDVLWMGTGDSDLNKGMSAITGALIGAGLGAVAGNAVSGSGNAAGMGAVAGGLAGGAIGAGLTPSAMENAKDLVKAICINIPKRG